MTFPQLRPNTPQTLQLARQQHDITLAFASICRLISQLTLVAALLPASTLIAQNIAPETEFNSVVLAVPQVANGNPAAGKRVKITPDEYAGTQVFHTLFLPCDWKPDGQPWPIIFEYTGNRFPTSGSTGRIEDASLGYGLTRGRFIWVTLPMVSSDGRRNQVTWWGDVPATLEYAKQNVPRIIANYHGDPQRVVLCGFSRGAIGVNYLGLHDDEISKIWTAFVTHDHFDGVQEWSGTDWGSPLKTYRHEARRRLRRIGNRPYLVCQQGSVQATESFVRAALPNVENFRFQSVDTRSALGPFPNAVSKHPHTDRWLLVPSPARQAAWKWLDENLLRGQ